MNKILLAGVLMFAGGFLLSDAAELGLLANASSSFSGSDRKAALAAVTPFPGATVEACKAEAKRVDQEYRTAVESAKRKRELGARAANLCIRKVNDARKASTR